MVDGGSASPEDTSGNEWETASMNSVSLGPLAVIPGIYMYWVMSNLMLLFPKINYWDVFGYWLGKNAIIYLKFCSWDLDQCESLHYCVPRVFFFALVEHYCLNLMKSCSDESKK